MVFFFFFKQKTAYEVRISDWSSDVCSSDLFDALRGVGVEHAGFDKLRVQQLRVEVGHDVAGAELAPVRQRDAHRLAAFDQQLRDVRTGFDHDPARGALLRHHIGAPSPAAAPVAPPTLLYVDLTSAQLRLG